MKKKSTDKKVTTLYLSSGALNALDKTVSGKNRSQKLEKVILEHKTSNPETHE